MHYCTRNEVSIMSEDTALTSSLKRGVWALLSLLDVLHSLVISNEVKGPLPPVVYAPINGTATFNCTYTNFDSKTDAWFWIVGDTEVNELDNPNIVSGGGENSTLRAKVPQQFEPIMIQCALYRRSRKIFNLLANSTVFSEIKPYGKCLLSPTVG